jgi:hypothetical protein
MGILGKLTGQDRSEDDFETPPCPHRALTPRWNNADEIGKKELATYVCEACSESFTYEQARPILEPAEPAQTSR